MLADDHHHPPQQKDVCAEGGFCHNDRVSERAGRTAGGGRLYVAGTLGLLRSDDESRRMQLLATQPVVTVDDVVTETVFELLIPDEVRINETPTSVEMVILRENVGWERLYIQDSSTSFPAEQAVASNGMRTLPEM